MVKKAFILAAGLGTRLRPLTLKTPKPLLPINNKPLLAYHLDSLKKYGVEEVLINTHYLPQQINDFVDSYNKNNSDLKVLVTFESDLLGSAGTILTNKGFVGEDSDFIVTYGDNLTDINYEKLIAEHQKNRALGTIATYHEEHPEQKGIIETTNNKITRFLEKPSPGLTKSREANAGIYVLSSEIFDIIGEEKALPLDFGFNVFPKILSSGLPLYTYQMTENVLDIGTPESYQAAQTLVKDMKI